MKTRKTPFAKRSLGQNFLVDIDCIDRIIAAVDPKPGDTIIEIGPGRGALTERFAQTEARMVAVEIDRDLVPELRQRFENNPSLEVIHADFLEIDVFEELGAANAQDLKVVGNLP